MQQHNQQAATVLSLVGAIAEVRLMKLKQHNNYWKRLTTDSLLLHHAAVALPCLPASFLPPQHPSEQTTISFRHQRPHRAALCSALAAMRSCCRHSTCRLSSSASPHATAAATAAGVPRQPCSWLPGALLLQESWPPDLANCSATLLRGGCACAAAISVVPAQQITNPGQMVSQKSRSCPTTSSVSGQRVSTQVSYINTKQAACRQNSSSLLPRQKDQVTGNAMLLEQP